MALVNLFKLEKMRIEGYLDERRRRPASPAQIEADVQPRQLLAQATRWSSTTKLQA